MIIYGFFEQGLANKVVSCPSQVKADVETQGDFVQSLATEVREAAYTDIEDVVAFVAWLDEELSFLVRQEMVLFEISYKEHCDLLIRAFSLSWNRVLLVIVMIIWWQVDERAVLKHFDWPESKADVLREASFEFQDLKKLEIEISSFEDDPQLSCELSLKKMLSLLEK